MQSRETTSFWTPVDIVLVCILAAVGVFLRLNWGLGDDGVFHPDEIYQVLEPAHELLYGFGLHAWEWDIGARNWSLPAVVAAVLGVARWLGFDQPESYIDVVRWLSAGLFSSSAFAVFMLARQHGASRLFAHLAAALFLLNPVTIYLGYRPLSEVFSTPFVLFGLVWLLRYIPQNPSASTHSADFAESADSSDRVAARERVLFVLGASLLGISVLFRLQNVIFAVIILGAWRLDGRMVRYQLALRVLTGWALIYGVIDWITWGLPYQSAGAYLRFNLILDGSTAYYGAASPFFYPRVFYTSMGLCGAILLVCPLLAWARARLLLICTLGFLLAHSLFPHKDLRFVIVTLPLLAALSAVGLQWGVDRLKGQNFQRTSSILVSGTALAAAIWSVAQVPNLTFGELGQAETLHLSPEHGAFDHPGELNRLLISASRRPDICGLFLASHWAVDAGGHTYFHRDVPFFHHGNPAGQIEMFNYVITDISPDSGWTAVRTAGAYTLYDTGRRRCAPAPDYQPIIYQAVEEEEKED